MALTLTIQSNEQLVLVSGKSITPSGNIGSTNWAKSAPRAASQRRWWLQLRQVPTRNVIEWNGILVPILCSNNKTNLNTKVSSQPMLITKIQNSSKRTSDYLQLRMPYIRSKAFWTVQTKSSKKWGMAHNLLDTNRWHQVPQSFGRVSSSVEQRVICSCLHLLGWSQRIWSQRSENIAVRLLAD